MANTIHSNEHYVAIVRHFRDANDEVHSPLERRLLRSLRPEKALTWDKLIIPSNGPTVVVHAGSGTGKSTEFKQQIIQLRAATDPVRCIYSEAGAIATEGFLESLEMSEAAAYQAWLGSTDPLVTFIDAVDELHLRQRRISDLFRRLERSFDLTTKRVQFIIGVRTGTWADDHTARLKNFLRRSGEGDPLVKFVTFEPIDRAALRALAVAYEVTDPDAFLDSFETEELDTLLELRPCDVKPLVSYWNRHGRFGRWSDLLADIIDMSTFDSNYARSRTLTTFDAASGLARIGAATVLGKKIHLALPSSPNSSDAISARRLFSDWPSSRLAELLETPLLVHKGTDAVQLPQGPITQFLAARWFAQRVVHGATVSSILDALLVRIAGEQGTRIPESRRQLLGWVASASPDLRASLLDSHAHVVLGEGDPDLLSDDEIEIALRRVVKMQASGITVSVPTPGTLRKLARPSLEQTLGELIDDHRTDAQVLWFLLNFASGRKYPALDVPAERIALSSSFDGHTRALAIAVVAANGDSRVIQNLHAIFQDTDEHVRTALLNALAPHALGGAELTRFIAAGGKHEFAAAVRRLTPKLSASVLDDILTLILPVLTSSIETAQTTLTLNIALPILVARLALADSCNEQIVSLLLSIERGSSRRSSSLPNDDRNSIDQWLLRHEDDRRALWLRRFDAAARRSNAFEYMLSPRYGDIQEADLEWLVNVIRGAEGKVKDCAAVVLRRCCDALERSGRERLRRLGVSIDLAAVLSERDHVHDDEDKRNAEQDLRKERSAAKTLQDNRHALESRIEGIRNGTDAGAIIWAWSQLADVDTNKRDVRLDLGGLEAVIGADYANAVIQGLRAFWRSQTIELRSPSNDGTSNAYLAGLTGLWLDVQAGLDFRLLTPSEAMLAARYALWEMHAFPFWLEDLISTHRRVVRDVIFEAVSLEWDFDAECRSVLRFARYSARTIGLVLREVTLELLSDRAPKHVQMVSCCADTILITRQDVTRVVPYLLRQIETDRNDIPRLCEWLRVWAHYDSITAAAWLERAIRARGERQRVETLVEAVAELLEQDLDRQLGFVTETALTSPAALQNWIRLLLRAIRPEDDIRHQDAYSPSVRDHAQDFRYRCLNNLASNPTAEAHVALRTLRSDRAMKPYTATIDRLLLAHAELMAEHQSSAWSESDIIQAECGGDRRPMVLEELFALVRKHVSVVRELLENHDFSYRKLFRPDTPETHIQLWAASSLLQVSRGLYSVVRENAVDDNKEVDISAFAAGVGRIPIEIKPLNRKKYSFSALCRVVDQQLAGQYMQPREVTFGILLLVMHQKRSWVLRRKARASFVELTNALQSYAIGAGQRVGKIIAIEGIDTTKLPFSMDGPDA